MVVEFGGPPPAGVEAKEVAALLDEEPVVDSEVLGLLRWVSIYYGAPLGETLGRCVPAAFSRVGGGKVTVKPAVREEVLTEKIKSLAARAPAQARILARLIGSREGAPRATLLKEVRAKRSSLRPLLEAGLLKEVKEEDLALPPVEEPVFRPPLTRAQREAVEEILGAVGECGFAPFLLFGVTGSGKTEVYLRVLERVIAEGGQGLILLPEIALTPQIYARFRARLRRVVLLHSLLAEGERARNMRAAKRGLADVVIGARSAVFTPFRNLRFIVVDEEHETSFKSDTAPRYHARDVAVVRAQRGGIPIVMGSATPSLESYRNALRGKYRLLRLPQRVTPRGLPHVRVVDLTRTKAGVSWLSPELVDLTANVLEAGRQAIFFLNRRGYARVVRCMRCGFVVSCKVCSVSMTYHRRGDMLLCHTCGAVLPRPDLCPQCGFTGLKYLGAGTERIMNELKRRFPSVRVGRLDRDTAVSRKRLLAVLEDFAAGRIDLLVGTQMLAKGHDFPNVTLVGIICADTALNLPDFRAAERTFQLIHQVAGRAGRGEESGLVVVQTFSPQNQVIQLAVAGEYERFAKGELSRREPLRYPPFGRLLRVVFRGRREEKVRAWADSCAEAVKKAGMQVLGPAPCTVTKIRGMIRYQIMVKGKDHRETGKAVVVLRGLSSPRSVETALDVDPVAFL